MIQNMKINAIAKMIANKYKFMKTIIKLSLIITIAALAAGCSFSPVYQNKTQPIQNQEKNINQNIPTGTSTDQKTQIANPASINCVNKGGETEIRERESLGQYGVCLFDDNRQCEEWAMYREECPVGGLKITGYNSDAAVFCAITGGTYAITASTSSIEQGKCKFKNNKECDVWEYYRGNCDQNSAKASEEKIAAAIYKCKGDKTIDATFFTDYVDIKLSDNRNLKLSRVISASGARYANEKESIVFWSKGNTAFVEENGKTTFDDCVEESK